MYKKLFKKKNTRCSISPNSLYWFLWHYLLPSLCLPLVHFYFFQPHKKLFLLQNRTKTFSFPISNFVFFCNCKKKLLKNQCIVAKSYTSLVNKGNCHFPPSLWSPFSTCKVTANLLCASDLLPPPHLFSPPPWKFKSKSRRLKEKFEKNCSWSQNSWCPKLQQPPLRSDWFLEVIWPLLIN